MSEQSRDETETDESSAKHEDYGSLTVEDDPDGTVDAADLAGSASPDDADVGPAANEADGL